MRSKHIILIAGLMAILLPSTQLSGGRPPRPGTANPELTFIEGSAIQVANRDGSNKVTLYSNKNASLRYPRMSPDHRSVVFREKPLRGQGGLLRTTFEVVNGYVVVGSTETLFQGDAGLDVSLHPLQPDGTRLAFVVGNAIYEMWKQRDCPSSPCTLDTVSLPLYVSAESLTDPLGGYTANGRALYFQEARHLATGYFADILRLEFPPDPGDPIAIPVSTVRADLPCCLGTLQTSRLDYSAAPFSYGPFETRLLVDGESSEPYETGIRTFDTWDGTLVDLLSTGHHARWSPDERSLVYVIRWQNAANGLRGRVLTLDRDAGVLLQIDDFSADPDWAPLQR